MRVVFLESKIKKIENTAKATEPAEMRKEMSVSEEKKKEADAGVQHTKKKQTVGSGESGRRRTRKRIKKTRLPK